MDLNKLDLPPFTIAELFRTSLVIPTEKMVDEASPVPPLKEVKSNAKWLGNNRKNILIAVNNNDTVHLPDNDLELLTGILSACKLGLEDVAIINLNNYPSQGYKELGKEFKSDRVFLFGIEPAEFGLPMNFPHFQPQSFSQVNYLSAPSLGQIANDREQKTKLWTSLKQIFKI